MNSRVLSLIKTGILALTLVFSLAGFVGSQVAVVSAASLKSYGASPAPAIIAADPQAARLTITVLNMKNGVKQGGWAGISIKTQPGAVCSITLMHHGKYIQNWKLVTKTAPQNGQISWSWVVDKNADPGEYRIWITAVKGKASAVVDPHFVVVKK